MSDTNGEQTPNSNGNGRGSLGQRLGIVPREGNQSSTPLRDRTTPAPQPDTRPVWQRRNQTGKVYTP